MTDGHAYSHAGRQDRQTGQICRQTKKGRERQTEAADGVTEGHTDRQTTRSARSNAQTEGETERQTDTQTDAQTHRAADTGSATDSCQVRPSADGGQTDALTNMPACSDRDNSNDVTAWRRSKFLYEHRHAD